MISIALNLGIINDKETVSLFSFSKVDCFCQKLLESNAIAVQNSIYDREQFPGTKAKTMGNVMNKFHIIFFLYKLTLCPSI